MTRQIHDQFAKDYLEELLTPLGTIKKSKKVKSEIQEIGESFQLSVISYQLSVAYCSGTGF